MSQPGALTLGEKLNVEEQLALIRDAIQQRQDAEAALADAEKNVEQALAARDGARHKLKELRLVAGQAKKALDSLLGEESEAEPDGDTELVVQDIQSKKPVPVRKKHPSGWTRKDQILSFLTTKTAGAKCSEIVKALNDKYQNIYNDLNALRETKHVVQYDDKTWHLLPLGDEWTKKLHTTP